MKIRVICVSIALLGSYVYGATIGFVSGWHAGMHHKCERIAEGK